LLPRRRMWRTALAGCSVLQQVQRMGPKRLLLGDGFGHAEDGLTPAFGHRLARVIHETLEVSWSE